MTRRPQIAWLADGRRLHLQDGPIDLIVEANGATRQMEVAYEAATRRFTGLLDELCAELPELRRAVQPGRSPLQGKIARRMRAAVAPFAVDRFITPMAAVAGAVAEEILVAMSSAATLDRAYVNNGGDIALHLADSQYFTVGLVDQPGAPHLIGRTVIRDGDPTRGIATSGWHGRSFSLGIADAVTILARTAAQADAAATVIANAVDLPGHPGIVRCPADTILPDSDLGGRLVTRHVGRLTDDEIALALEAGETEARALLAAGLIEGASLHVQGRTNIVALNVVNEAATHRRSPADAGHPMHV